MGVFDKGSLNVTGSPVQPPAPGLNTQGQITLGQVSPGQVMQVQGQGAFAVGRTAEPPEQWTSIQFFPRGPNDERDLKALQIGINAYLRTQFKDVRFMVSIFHQVFESYNFTFLIVFRNNHKLKYHGETLDDMWAIVKDDGFLTACRMIYDQPMYDGE